MGCTSLGRGASPWCASTPRGLGVVRSATPPAHCRARDGGRSGPL